MRNHGDHTTRRLTNDELKAAEAAFQGLAFDEAWSKAARTVYEGIVIVKMTRRVMSFWLWNTADQAELMPAFSLMNVHFGQEKQWLTRHDHVGQ